MKIYVPTLGRAGTVQTLRYIPQATLLVHSSEEAAYRAAYPTTDIMVLPDELKGIAKIREYIVRTLSGSEKVLSLDDDLSFYRRKDPTSHHLIDAEPVDIAAMLAEIEHQLDTYAHVAIAPREGYPHYAMHGGVPIKMVNENVRYVRAIGMNPAKIPATVEFTRCPVMEDFDVALQLLRLGLPSATLVAWAQGQPQTQADGGCSTYRTQELQSEAAYKLQDLHPEFVRVTMKNNASGGDFGERTDVQIYWKKAYESSFPGYVSKPLKVKDPTDLKAVNTIKAAAVIDAETKQRLEMMTRLLIQNALFDPTMSDADFVGTRSLVFVINDGVVMSRSLLLSNEDQLSSSGPNSFFDRLSAAQPDQLQMMFGQGRLRVMIDPATKTHVTKVLR